MLSLPSLLLQSSCRRPVQCPLEAPEGGLEPQFGDRIRLGVLTEGITAEVVDDVLELTGRAERRRRLLPARAVVYFVLALCLFSSSDNTGPPGYRVVLRTLTEKLRHLPGGHVQRLLTSSTLTRARQRLGDKPFQALFERRCGAQATPPERSPSACGWSTGTAPHWTYRTPPRTPPRSGSPAATDRQKRKPQVRRMTLLECGTHTIIDAAFDSIARFSEHKLSRIGSAACESAGRYATTSTQRSSLSDAHSSAGNA